MSIRLDPRRVGVLKRLAGETGMRPGDLVRQWVEERIDAARQGIDTPDAAKQISTQLAELAARVASLEAAAGVEAPAGGAVTESRPEDAPEQKEADAQPATTDEDEAAAEPETEAAVPVDESSEPAPSAETKSPKRTKRVTAAPSGPRVALHDEMIAVISERGPMTAGELATVIAERGRYQPPRSGKPLDAAMVSQRVSNPVYRARFTRNDGRIGLAEAAE